MKIFNDEINTNVNEIFSLIRSHRLIGSVGKGPEAHASYSGEHHTFWKVEGISKMSSESF